MEDFVYYKEEMGIKTIPVTTDDIYSGKYFEVCSGDEQKIKFFIKNAYDEWKIKICSPCGFIRVYSYSLRLSQRFQFNMGVREEIHK